MNKLFLLFYLTFFLFSSFASAQVNENFVKVHLKNETFQKGKLLIVESDYYFNIETGYLVIQGNIPKNNIKISNRLGELKIYYPDEKEVAVKQNQYFSSENELIYYFLSNNYYDLGLSNEGYRIAETKMDGSHQIVTWTAPVATKAIAKVDLVFENGQPVYAAYFNLQGEIMRKIYYYNYKIFRNFMMPMKVTQISYTSDGDSVIQRNTWSGLKVSATPDSDYFNFKIPEDAKVIQ